MPFFSQYFFCETVRCAIGFIIHDQFHHDVILPLLQHRALCLSREHEHSACVSLFSLGHPSAGMRIKHMDCFTCYEYSFGHLVCLANSSHFVSAAALGHHFIFPLKMDASYLNQVHTFNIIILTSLDIVDVKFRT